MYEELEKLQEKYPIGTQLNIKEWYQERKLSYYSERDLIEYRRKYGKIQVLDEVYCLIKEKNKVCKVVAGYLYNGENWIIVENTWDGYVPINVEDE